MTADLPSVDLAAASPFVAAMKFEVTEATGTRVTGHVDLGPDQHTPWGVVHGGLYCSIVESAVPSRLTIKLDFTKPFKANNLVDYTLSPENGGTRVTWDMHGPNALIGKVISVFMDMDKMVGGDFEKGLAKLKAVAER